MVKLALEYSFVRAKQDIGRGDDQGINILLISFHDTKLEFSGHARRAHSVNLVHFVESVTIGFYRGFEKPQYTAFL